MLRSRASALQRAMSARMNSPNCSGVIGIGSSASPARRSRSAGAASALLISALSRRVISGQLRRPDDAVPLHAVEALVAELLERRQIRLQRVALESGNGERP